MLLLLFLLALTKAQECPSGALAAKGGSCSASTTKPLECSVYMAPSTLGEDTNIGIYTAVPLQTNDVVNYPEIAIPLLFREWGEHKEGYDDGTLWDRYIWEGPVVDLEPYQDTDREDSRAVFVPGVGCSINSILDMNNIDSTHGSTYDTAGLHRKQDPGVGAFTPYHGSETTAVTDIPAGAELFAEYGDGWIPSIPGAQVTSDDVMDEAEVFLREEYFPFVQQHDLNDALKQALWEFTKDDFPIYSQTASVLPRAPWSDVEAELSKTDSEESVIRKFVRKQTIRDIEWLQQNGYCQDHLKPGRSTIAQAGRGAFATRRLPAGAVVGYSPLVHMGIHGREVLDIEYDDDQHQYDLVINYSFGHTNSSILLTPYGAMVNYINHHKERTNVKVRWPNKELVAHKPEWLHKDPNFLRDTLDKIGLSFEYIALRDIEEGEEIFMDYGDEWEAAWKEHVKNWQPPEDAMHYVHSSGWKEDHFRTVSELESSPYPPNLHTMCHQSYSAGPDGTYHWIHVLRDTPHRTYCHVLERIPLEDGTNLYTVSLEIDEDEWITVHNFQEDSIFLYDKAFSSDWHLPNAFRHEIMIPDDIMPQAWQNGPPQRPW